VNIWLFIASLGLSCIALAGCDDGHLRGPVAPSADGGTYLAIVDGNAGACGPLLLDGKPWPYKVGEPGPVAPGRHLIDCGGEIGFDIPQGIVFKFDYWGRELAPVASCKPGRVATRLASGAGLLIPR
jgi:hypothetical protein